MTSPSSEPQTADDARAVRRASSGDRLATSILLVLLFFFMLLVGFFPGMSLASYGCSRIPGSCNDVMIAIATFMGGPALLAIFIASVVVSVVLLVRKRLAFYVPLFAAVAMVLSWVAWFLLTREGLGV